MVKSFSLLQSFPSLQFSTFTSKKPSLERRARLDCDFVFFVEVSVKLYSLCFFTPMLNLSFKALLFLQHFPSLQCLTFTSTKTFTSTQSSPRVRPCFFSKSPSSFIPMFLHFNAKLKFQNSIISSKLSFT